MDRTGAGRIAAERVRVLVGKGWTPEHDAMHDNGELARAAAAYALPLNFVIGGEFLRHDLWPWDPDEWKPCPDDRIRELVKAGQLIAAEIDRLLALREKSNG